MQDNLAVKVDEKS